MLRVAQAVRRIGAPWGASCPRLEVPGSHESDILPKAFPGQGLFGA